MVAKIFYKFNLGCKQFVDVEVQVDVNIMKVVSGSSSKGFICPE